MSQANIKRADARRHFAVEELSGSGRAVVDEMLGQGHPTYRAIVDAVLAKTGEHLTVSSLSRYYHARFKEGLEFEREEARRRQEWIDTLIATIRETGSSDATEIANQLIKIGLAFSNESIRKADPVRLLKAQVEMEKLKIEQERNAIDREKLEVIRQRMAAAVANLKQQTSAAAGRSLTEDEAKKIEEEVYGITR